MFKRKNSGTNTRVRSSTIEDKTLFTYTYHNVREKFDDQISARKEKKTIIPKLIYPFQKLGALIILVVIIIAVVNLLYLSPTPKVFLLNNNTKVSALYDSLYGQNIYSFVKNYLDSSLFNYSKLSINLNNLNSSVTSKFPIVTNVSYNIPLLNSRVEIYLTTSSPVLLVSSNNHEYVVNQTGQVVLINHNYRAIAQLSLPTIVMNLSNIKLGESLFRQQEISFIQTINQQLLIKNYQITDMKVSGSGEELDVYLAGKPYYIKFNLAGGDALLEAGRFLAAINYLNVKKITPSQYIDIRSGGRVFYK